MVRKPQSWAMGCLHAFSDVMTVAQQLVFLLKSLFSLNTPGLLMQLFVMTFEHVLKQS